MLDAHEETWLGELAGVLYAESNRFARGFVAQASVTTEELPRLIASEDATTLETLWLIPHGDFDASLLHSPNLRGLRFVGGLEPAMFGVIAAAGPYPFEGVGFDLFDMIPNKGEPWTDEQRAARDELLRLRVTFPKVTELAVRAYHRDPAELAFLWTSPFAAGLSRLRLSSVGSTPYWLAHQDSLPKSVSSVEVSFDFGIHAWATELRRDEAGRFSRVVATLRPKRRDHGAVALDDIVGGLLDEVDADALTEVEVRADGVRVTQDALDAIAAAAHRHTRLTSLRLPGRPPLDVTKVARSSEPVLTQKERDRLAHAGTAKALAQRVQALAAGVLDPAKLGTLDTLDFAETSALERVRALLPTLEVDPRWAEIALLLLTLPMPSEPARGYSNAHHGLMDDVLRVYARARPERPFARLLPVLDNLSAQRAIAVVGEHPGVLIKRDELPLLLDWFETRKTMDANNTYYTVRALIGPLLGPDTRRDLEERLATHKLNRFHRWAYEEALKRIP